MSPDGSHSETARPGSVGKRGVLAGTSRLCVSEADLSVSLAGAGTIAFAGVHSGGMTKVGILGGTFDPPHLGHIRFAGSALGEFGLDVVLFIPAGDPYHRRRGSGFELAGIRPDLSAAADRLEMVRLSVSQYARFEVDDREVRRRGPSFTVDTLIELGEERAGAELFLLLGADSAAELHRWRGVARIEELATVLIAPRGERSPGSGQLPIPFRPVHMPRLEITSTAIRSLVRAARPWQHLVPEPVADYIVARGLYTETPAGTPAG